MLETLPQISHRGFFVVGQIVGGNEDEVIIESATSMETVVDVMARVEEREELTGIKHHKLRVVPGKLIESSEPSVKLDPKFNSNSSY